MPRFVYACEPGWEGRLIDELHRVFPDSLHSRLAAGWVAGEVGDGAISALGGARGTVPSFSGPPSADEKGDCPRVPCIALCSQCLPLAEEIHAKSISEWGQATGRRIIAGLADHDGPWRLDVFSVYRGGHLEAVQRGQSPFAPRTAQKGTVPGTPKKGTVPGSPVGPRRCQLIRENIESLLQKKQRRLRRTLGASNRSWQNGEALVQVGLVKPDLGYFSLCDGHMLRRWRRMVAPFCGGIAEIPADRRAPSRAFAKLLEAELRIGRQIGDGESCVDLGSSPGSWAYVALRRGARVVAIDRSPLRADLMANPRLTFSRGDAFAYRPPERVDWLLCDVIAAPERIIDRLQTWIGERWCRRFCVTIKFRGTTEYGVLQRLESWLAAAGVGFILRRLTNNKNEVTAVGELPV